MTQKNIEIFINQIYSKPPKKNFVSNKTDVFYINDIWSLDIFDIKDYGPENDRHFIKIWLDSSSQKQKCSNNKGSFENILLRSKRKPNLIETDRGKDFYNNIFRDILNKNNKKHYCRNSSYGAVIAERYIYSKRNLLKRPVFEQGDVKWIDVLPKITEQYNNRIHSSTKLTPIQESLKKMKDLFTKFY